MQNSKEEKSRMKKIKTILDYLCSLMLVLGLPIVCVGLGIAAWVHDVDITE